MHVYTLFSSISKRRHLVCRFGHYVITFLIPLLTSAYCVCIKYPFTFTFGGGGGGGGAKNQPLYKDY